MRRFRKSAECTRKVGWIAPAGDSGPTRTALPIQLPAAPISTCTCQVAASVLDPLSKVPSGNSRGLFFTGPVITLPKLLKMAEELEGSHCRADQVSPLSVEVLTQPHQFWYPARVTDARWELIL